jgi:hypothetical protein
VSRYSDTLLDENSVPVAGADVYVYDNDGALASLEDDDEQSIDNPVRTDEDGNYSFNVVGGIYTLDYWYGGRRRLRRQGVPIPDDELAAQFKGDPGGNTMAIGLFTAASGLLIPEGTDLVQTSGYSVVGYGHARYAYDEDVDAAYVIAHPRSSFVSSNGRGFRLVEAPINIQSFGAIPGNGTDCYAAFVAAIAYIGAVNTSGGQIFIPAGRYRISDRLVIPHNVSLLGEGNTQNPGIVDGVTYSYPDYYMGSVLYFDAGKAGLDILPHTTEEDAALVIPAVASYFDLQQALRTVIRDLFLLSADNAQSSGAAFDADLNGIQARQMTMLQNVWVSGFRGHGVRIAGTTDGAGVGALYGHTNFTTMMSVHSIKNAGSGFKIEGRDANVIGLYSCNGTINKRYGFEDDGFLGNVYVGCHCAGNTLGAFKGDGTSAAHTYLGCYTEDTAAPGNQSTLSQHCVVLGGIMAGAQFHPESSRALVMTGAGAIRGTLGSTNVLGDVNVKAGFGADPSHTAANTILWFGNINEAATLDAWRLKYDDAVKAYRLNFANGGASQEPLQFAAMGSSWRGGVVYAPSFPQGIFLGSLGAGCRITDATAEPTTGTFNRGDVIFNRTPSAGGTPGWRCTTAGVAGSTAVFKAMANLAA